VRRHLRQRFWARDGDPGPIAWSIAAISLVLPVAGLVLCLIGGIQALRGVPAGWTWLGFGAACVALDILIDFVWAHPRLSESDLPHLNRRADQLAGRVAIITEAIEAGRGKVKLGDTLWVAEGPDLPAGAIVRIAAARTTVLVVEPVGAPPDCPGPNPPQSPSGTGAIEGAPRPPSSW
jgi:membrane protein implicated in regulation of membrane protease activity